MEHTLRSGVDSGLNQASRCAKITDKHVRRCSSGNGIYVLGIEGWLMENLASAITIAIFAKRRPK